MDLSPVYILLGEEDLLKESALSDIKKKCFPSEDQTILSFNFVSIDGKSVTSSQIIQECQQLPIMSNKRLIVVKDAERIMDDKLSEYLQNPAETTCLVLILRKIDKRLGIYKTLGKYAEIQEYDHPNERDVINWIQQYIKAKKKRISLNDATSIADILENNLTGIMQELDKLITYAGNRENITEKDIETILSENKSWDSFALTNEIQNKNASGAIKKINDLLDQGNSVQQILGSIRWALTRLWQVKDGDGKELNIPPYFLSKLKNQAEKFSFAELKNGLIKLLAIEKLIRTYDIPDNLVLELLAIQLTQPLRAGAGLTEKTKDLVNAQLTPFPFNTRLFPNFTLK